MTSRDTSRTNSCPKGGKNSSGSFAPHSLRGHGFQLVVDAGEQVGNVQADGGDGGDAHAGDEADQQAVLDQGGALFLLGEELPGPGQLVLDLDVKFQHEPFSFERQGKKYQPCNPKNVTTKV